MNNIEYKELNDILDKTKVEDLLILQKEICDRILRLIDWKGVKEMKIKCVLGFHDWYYKFCRRPAIRKCFRCNIVQKENNFKYVNVNPELWEVKECK